MLIALTAVLAVSGCATAPRHSAANASYSRPAPVSLDTGRFSWPVKGAIVQIFGEERDGVRNKGLDILAVAGESVAAASDGKVVFVDQNFRGFGKTLIIEHGGSYQTVYGYNSEILVREGEEVKKGGLIAKAGYCRRLNRPALHFEVRRQGRPVDPLHYLSK